MTACTPLAMAWVIATVIPRSLNEPVGLAPSTFRYTSHPVSSDRCGADSSGVLPSASVTTQRPRGSGCGRGIRLDDTRPARPRTVPRSLEACAFTRSSPSTRITLSTSRTTSSCSILLTVASSAASGAKWVTTTSLAVGTRIPLPHRRDTHPVLSEHLARPAPAHPDGRPRRG